MNILKLLLRFGAIGGTARTIAKQYKHYRKLHPERTLFQDYIIYRLIILDRYKILKNDKLERILMEKAASMKGIKELVISILTLEAGYDKNSVLTQLQFEEVIVEELLKKGLSKEEIEREDF